MRLHLAITMSGIIRVQGQGKLSLFKTMLRQEWSHDMAISRIPSLTNSSGSRTWKHCRRKLPLRSNNRRLKMKVVLLCLISKRRVGSQRDKQLESILEQREPTKIVDLLSRQTRIQSCRNSARITIKKHLIGNEQWMRGKKACETMSQT